MTHNITLNLNTDLKFKVVAVSQLETVSRASYSVEKSEFVDIERTRNLGFVDVSSADGESVTATVDGENITGAELTFYATEHETPDGTRTILWDVYNYSYEGPDSDVDLEKVPTADIPDVIVDMLLEL